MRCISISKQFTLFVFPKRSLGQIVYPAINGVVTHAIKRLSKTCANSFLFAIFIMSNKCAYHIHNHSEPFIHLTYAPLCAFPLVHRTCGNKLNTLRPSQNGRHFPDDIFKCIFLNENVWISIKIPLKFVPKGPINNIPALFQIMAWLRPGDKPLSETMMVTLLTHICVTRPQWFNNYTLVPTIIIRYCGWNQFMFVRLRCHFIIYINSYT